MFTLGFEAIGQDEATKGGVRRGDEETQEPEAGALQCWSLR